MYLHTIFFKFLLFFSHSVYKAMNPPGTAGHLPYYHPGRGYAFEVLTKAPGWSC